MTAIKLALICFILLVQKMIHLLQIRWILKGEKHFWHEWAEKDGGRTSISEVWQVRASSLDPLGLFTYLSVTCLSITDSFFPLRCPPSWSCAVFEFGLCFKTLNNFYTELCPHFPREHVLTWKNHQKNANDFLLKMLNLLAEVFTWAFRVTYVTTDRTQ